MKKHISCIFIALSLGYVSCQPNTQKTVMAENASDATGSLMDTIPPGIAIQGPIQILLPGRYRKETSYPENTNKKDWYALYFDKGAKQWTIKNTALKISYGMDECVGDSIMIVQNHNNVILFIRGITNLEEYPLTALTDRMLLPERNVNFDLSGKSYQLMAMGSYLDNEGNYLPSDAQRRKTEAALAEDVIEHYQLSFLVDGASSQRLATQEEIKSDGQTPKLLWAGDLNGDRLPDLIIDIAGWYESRQILLFLSDKKDKEHFLKKVAEIIEVNDC